MNEKTTKMVYDYISSHHPLENTISRMAKQLKLCKTYVRGAVAALELSGKIRRYSESAGNAFAYEKTQEPL